MHKSTVSKALSGRGTISTVTQNRVRAVARELGYEPNPLAQRLASGYRNPMVYIFGGSLDLGLGTQKVRLIQNALNDRLFEVAIYTCPELAGDQGRTQAAQIKQLCRQRPRAIVCASQMIKPDVFRELETYQREGGIVVSYDTPTPLSCDQVIFDREHNAYQTARYLLDRGHRKIGIGISRMLEPVTEAARLLQAPRLRGFQRALQEFGVAPSEQWLFENGQYEKGGAEMAQHFLQIAERPTGLCIVNDFVAFAFMVDVMRAGVRVPEDVSIISHDNQPIASRCPVPMTSATQPVEQIAQAVVTMLMERIEGDNSPARTVTVQGELVERESVVTPGGTKDPS